MASISYFLNNKQLEKLERYAYQGESLSQCAKRFLLASMGEELAPEEQKEKEDNIVKNDPDIQTVVNEAIARLIGDKIRPLEIRVEMLNHQLSQPKIVEAPKEAIERSIEHTIESSSEVPNEAIEQEQTIEYLSSNALSKKLGVSKTTVLRWKKKSTISPDGKWEYDADKQGWRSLD